MYLDFPESKIIEGVAIEILENHPCNLFANLLLHGCSKTSVKYTDNNRAVNL